MFVPVGLSSFLHILQVLLGVEVSTVGFTAVPFNYIRFCKPFGVLMTSSAGRFGCRDFYSSRKNDERPTGTNTTIERDDGET